MHDDYNYKIPGYELERMEREQLEDEEEPEEEPEERIVFGVKL